MPPLEEYLEQADNLAQDVINAWAVNMKAGNRDYLTDQFRTLFNKALLYQDAGRLAGNHRKHGLLSDEDAADEKATRQAFAEEYKAFYERHAGMS